MKNKIRNIRGFIFWSICSVMIIAQSEGAEINKVTISFIDPTISTPVKLSAADVKLAALKEPDVATYIEIRGEKVLANVNKILASMNGVKIGSDTHDSLDARIVFQLWVNKSDCLQVTFQSPGVAEWNNVATDPPSKEIREVLLRLLPLTLFEDLNVWKSIE